MNVLRKPNHSPTINANNLKILQHSNFDALNSVSAFDEEDGHLTDKVKTLNVIDTTILNDQELCYFVEDSQKLSTTKCIIVSIYTFQELMSKVRYVSRNNIFYNQTLPDNWLSKQIILEQVLISDEVLETYTLN